jgi:hypothetical protein
MVAHRGAAGVAGVLDDVQLGVRPGTGQLPRRADRAAEILAPVHLQRMPLTFFTHSRTAELQIHLVTDVDGLNDSKVTLLTRSSGRRLFEDVDCAGDYQGYCHE